jgi:Regulator of ribonuclease activity B
MNSLPEQVAELRAGHNARNAELTQRLLSSGVDLSATRRIDLHFWAPDEHEAHSLSDLLKAKDYSVTTLIRESADNNQWNVEAHIESSVQRVTSETFTFELIDLASGVNSQFDGWGTAV